MPAFFFSACDKKYFRRPRNLSWSSAIIVRAGWWTTNMRILASVLISLRSVALPCSAQTVLKSEPLALAPYEVAFVQDDSCPAGQGAQGDRRDPGAASQAGLRVAQLGAGFARGGDAVRVARLAIARRSGTARGARCLRNEVLTSQNELQLPLSVAFGVRLVLRGVLVRLRLARPDLVIIVQHGPWRSLAVLRRRRPRRDRCCRASFQTSASAG